MVLGEGLEGATSGVNKSLTLGQKSSLGTKLIPSPKTTHPYIVGFVLIVVGGFSLVGSLTGDLPAMIAALFVPDALEDKNGNSGGDFVGQLILASESVITAGVVGGNPFTRVWNVVKGSIK
jgi:hypothetical protein